MGTVTRDYLRAHRLTPTQCTPNMFRILGSVDALNERMGLGHTHHDINWVYNLHHLKGQGYYLKSGYLEVRLIQCLPESNKGLKKDFLIVSGDWHDGLSCPTREGQPGGVLDLGRLCLKLILLHSSFLFYLYLKFFVICIYFFFLIRILFVLPNRIVDKNAAIPNFSLMN